MSSIEFDPALGATTAPELRVNLANMRQTLDMIVARARRREGFTLFTVNLDHIVKIGSNRLFREAYERADFVTADGWPIVWIMQRDGYALERTAGADLLEPVCARAAEHAMPVYFVGPGAASQAAGIDVLRQRYQTALDHPDICGLVVGTRPDCLPDETLDYLETLGRHTFVELEIGIESCNDAVLFACHRGHDFACTRSAILRSARRHLFITGHLLLGLPLETRESLCENAEKLACLPIDALKFHQLQVVRGTQLAHQYRADPSSVPLMSPETYLDAVADMLERLPSHIKIQRLGSEVPPGLRLSPDWGMRLSLFPARLTACLEARNTWQGKRVCADSPPSG